MYFICPQWGVYIFYMSTVGCVHILYVHIGVCTYFICPQWGVYIFYMSTVGCVRILYVHSGVCTYFICPQWGVYIFYMSTVLSPISIWWSAVMCTSHSLRPRLSACRYACMCVCMYVCMCVQAFPSVLCVCVVHVQMTPSHTHCISV